MKKIVTSMLLLLLPTVSPVGGHPALASSSLQNAYDMASSGDVIHLLQGDISGDFIAGRDILVYMQGGYNSDYSDIVSYTNIEGKMSISAGTVVIDDGSIHVGGAPAGEPPPVQYLVFGSGGSGDGQFNYPRGIVQDSSGNIYVADSGNHRIQKFTSSGIFISRWGDYGSAAGQFMQPSGLALNIAKSALYVVDSQNHRVQVFDLQGNFIRQFGSYGSGNGELMYPRGIAADGNGYFYVTDVNNNRIQKFDGGGSFVTAWGSAGSGNGQFNSPYGIATDSDNNVYVMEFYGHRGQKFTPSGAFISTWGTQGNSDGQFNWPDGIAVNDDGLIFVCDEGNNRLEKFTAEGAFLSKIGGYGAEISFSAPHNIYLDDYSNAYVTDELNNRIQIIPYGYNGF
jgi:DNA-binding beta-propeller fold protein YncE